MQTTLLGLAIAFIIALVAALVGPHFVDWNQFRPQFEAEASRIIGAPVRVGGGLDARLLPAPSLRLRSILVGGANDPGRIRADKLDVEFSLGALLRGEWRATELTVNGLSLDLGLDQSGRLDWPIGSGNDALASLAIDRLNLTGRIALHDARSRSTLELQDIAFSGDVRALAGSLRGNGNFLLAGARYPFRVTSSQNSDGSGTRVHLTLEPGTQGIAVDLDGALSFDARVPRFEGAMTLARTAPDGTAPDSVTPWRVTAKLKADPAKAALTRVETSFGNDDAALKLTGLADLRFGATPLLQALLSARQLDLDKLLEKQGGAAEAARILPGLQWLLTSMPQAMLPTRIDINAERVLLGGRPVQDLDLTLRADASAWSVDRLELRAPGATDVSIQGAMAPSEEAENFKGALKVDSTDPATFAAWLTGRGDVVPQLQKPLHVSGDVHFGSKLMEIDNLKAEVDGGTVAGRLRWAARSSTTPSVIEADMRADRLDLDAAAAFVQALGSSQETWPDRGVLSLNVAQAISSGQELRPVVAKLHYDPKTIALDEVRIGQANGLTLDGSGVFQRDAATGKLALQAGAPSVRALAPLIEPWAPVLAERLKADTLSATEPAQLKLGLDLDKDAKDGKRAGARATLELASSRINGTVKVRAAPTVAAIRGLDGEALARAPLDIEVDAAADDGAALLRLAGLDRAIVAGDGPARLTGTGHGTWHAAWQVKGNLSAGALAAEAHGSIEPAGRKSADLTFKLRNANIAPLLGLAPASSLAQVASLSAHLTRQGDKLQLSDVDASLAGTRLRGRVGATLGDTVALDGQLGMDALNLPQAFALLIGSVEQDNGAPLGRGLTQGWRGQLGFQALRGQLPGDIELQPVSGVVKGDGQSVKIEALSGKVGGGEIKADIDARPSDDGLALSGSVQFDGVDGAALRYRDLAMPGGRAALRMTFASHGRSVSALTGALTGSGTLTIDAARIAGLNPNVFEAAMRASDGGKATNEDQLRQLIGPELQQGELAVKRAQIPFLLRDGRLSVGATPLEADGVRAVISGGYDIVADQVDIRANLESLGAPLAGGRPQLELFTVGPPGRLQRSVDVAALWSWLAMRAIDRETQRLDAIEQGRVPPAASAPPPEPAPAPEPAPTPAPAPPAAEPAPEVPLPEGDPRRASPKPKESAPKPVPPQQMPTGTTRPTVAPLPPPIEVRPAPGTTTHRPRPRAPLVLTPPPAQQPLRPGL